MNTFPKSIKTDQPSQKTPKHRNVYKPGADNDDKEKETVKIFQKSEEELGNLESEIEKLRQRLRLLKSEEEAEIAEKDELIAEQQKRIKELKSTIDSLRTLIKRGQQGDERVLKKAFQKHYQEIGITKDKSALEVAEILEDRVFDLSKKRDLLLYEIQKKQSILEEIKSQYHEIDQLCQGGEIDKKVAERAKQLENDYQRSQMRISEMEYIHGIYKEILNKFGADLATLPPRIDELEREFKTQKSDLESMKQRETKGEQLMKKARDQLSETEIKALEARQEKEMVTAEFNQTLENKQQQIHDPKRKQEREKEYTSLPEIETEQVLSDMRINQEKQLEYYKEQFEQIKTATGVADIEDAEKRFASQKAVRTNLLELKKKSEKMLMDLKLEKEKLESQVETMMGGSLVCPKATLEDTVEKCKREHEEQIKRKEDATIEHEKITKTLAEVKTSLWQLYQLMQRHTGTLDLERESSEYSVTELADMIFKIHTGILDMMKEHDPEKLLQQMKSEKHFLNKLEDDQASDEAVHHKPKPQAVEESSSKDEIKKRPILKKDAQNFADMKQKQKGRGRGIRF